MPKFRRKQEKNKLKSKKLRIKNLSRYSKGSFILTKRKAKTPYSLVPTLYSFLKEYWYVFFALILIGFISYFLIFKDLPSPRKLHQAEAFAASTRIFDRNGNLLFEIFADRNRTPVSLNNLPDYVKQAHIAIEDKNFYKHYGFASEGLLRATFNTLFRKKLQGGSTITQQLVKTALLTPERTLRRKIREAILTLFTELIYSKDQILEMYLNHVPYGGTAWGIEAASQTYFNKKAKDLSLAEAAMLAGLPAAPTRYSPFGANPDLAKDRQRLVLSRMLEDGYITQEQSDEAASQELEFATPTVEIKAPHFVLWVKELLEEKYGEHLVERGGLKVTTTLDLDLQEYAQATVAAEIADLEKMQVTNGAALITLPKTGEILAMVGSHDFFDFSSHGQVNVPLRPRQPGSSIKPINYATAFETGRLNPASVLLDIPTCFFVPGQPLYCPRNYDNAFHGPVQVRFALGNSYNIPAVKTLAINSVENMIATASAMGITGWKDPTQYGLSLTLGGGEVRMVDMAVAFGVFANQGIKVPLHPVLKVQDQQGNILEEYNPQKMKSWVDQLNHGEELSEDTKTDELPARALSRETAYLISHILLDNNARSAAFGTSSQLVIRGKVVSVKTGTTNDLRDNWTLGFTPSYLVATWVGNNDNTPMHPYLVSGITGAAPIWHELMDKVLEGKAEEWPEKPDGIVGLNVCLLSGLLPNPENPCETRHEFFIKGSEPTQIDISHRGIWIKKDTSLPPEEGDFENLELQEHLVVSDPLVKDFCLDCPWPQEIDENGQPTGKIHYPQITINPSLPPTQQQPLIPPAE
jgi:penicillin-binding protein 1C